MAIINIYSKRQRKIRGEVNEPLRFSWRVFCLSDQAATSRSFSEA